MTKPHWKTRLFHLLFRFSRPMTLGVRVLLQDEEDRILLVRHTYVPGWHLPGGGVEKGHTLRETAAKELSEETGIRAEGTMELLAMFANRQASKRDHVALMRCETWQFERKFTPNREIAEIGFFDLASLPSDVTPSTRRRLEEYFSAKPHPDLW